VVFVAVRQNDRANALAILLQVGNVRDDQVDAQELRFREHHAGVNNNDVVAVAQRHHVHAKFAETT
jgi:hypothetical protein